MIHYSPYDGIAQPMERNAPAMVILLAGAFYLFCEDAARTAGDA